MKTLEEGKGAVALPGTIYQTAQEVEQLGGQCIPIQCDHIFTMHFITWLPGN